MIGRTNAMKIDGGGGDWKVITLHGGVGEVITATDSDGVQYNCYTNSLGDGIIVVESGKTYTFVGSRGQYSVVATIDNTLTDLNVYNESYHYWCGRKIIEPYQVIPNMSSASQDGWTVGGDWAAKDDYGWEQEYNKAYNACKSGRYAKTCSYYTGSSGSITISKTTEYPFCTSAAVYVSESVSYGKTANFAIYPVSGTAKSTGYKTQNQLLKIENINTTVKQMTISVMMESSAKVMYGVYAANNRSDVGIFGYSYGKYKV